MEKTIISFEDFQESLKNNTLSELFEADFDIVLEFSYPEKLDERSGYFHFMINYIQKNLSKKLNLKGDDIASDKFYVKDDNFYYNDKLVLSCTKNIENNRNICNYFYYQPKK